MYVKRIIILLAVCCMNSMNCFSQHIYQLLYSRSGECHVEYDNGMFQSKNSQRAEYVHHYMFGSRAGLALDFGLNFYDFSNANISKNTVTRFEFGIGLTGSYQMKYKGFFNGITISAIPVLLFSPQFGPGVKLTADTNISMINLGVSWYPFKQKVFIERTVYYFEPVLQFRAGIFLSSLWKDYY